MPKLLLHFDWIDGYAVQAPVGIWDERGENYYPEPLLSLKKRAHRAIRPAARTWDAHIAQLTDTTSAYNANWAIRRSEEPLSSVYQAVWNEFLATAPPSEPIQFHTGGGGPESNDDRDAEQSNGSASRFVLVESWWIASELARRHPRLVVHEMHPGGGMYDVLALLDPAAGDFHEQTRVMINRTGSIQIHHSTSSGLADMVVASWEDALTTDDPHRLVKAVEASAGLGPSSPATTERSIAYRFIATALAMTTHDRHRWDARNEFIDSSGDWWPGDPETHGFLSRYSAARADAGRAPGLGLWGEPASHFWGVLRDDVPVALLSIEGRVYRDETAMELLPIYRSVGRSMTRLVTETMGDLLP